MLLRAASPLGGGIGRIVVRLRILVPQANGRARATIWCCDVHGTGPMHASGVEAAAEVRGRWVEIPLKAWELRAAEYCSYTVDSEPHFPQAGGQETMSTDTSSSLCTLGGARPRPASFPKHRDGKTSTVLRPILAGNHYSSGYQRARRGRGLQVWNFSKRC